MLGFLFSYSMLMLGTARLLTRATLRRFAGGISALGTCIALIMPFFGGKIYGL